MKPTPAQPAFTAFTATPGDCLMLDKALCITWPSVPPIGTFGHACSQALLRVLAPDWDGLASSKGLNFKARVICEASCLLILRSGQADAPVLNSVLSAIVTLRAQFGDEGKAERAIQRVINKAGAAMTKSLGYYGHPMGDGRAASAIMSALIATASRAQIAKLAPRILPPWQREADPALFVDAEAFARVYRAHFAHGGSLEDIFAPAPPPTPERSAAEHIQSKIQSMPTGPIRAAFDAAFEQRAIAGALRAPLERQADAWESRGLPADKMSALLALTSLLEQAHPGRGADEAIAQLRAHPSLQALEARSSAKPEPAPAHPKRRM